MLTNYVDVSSVDESHVVNLLSLHKPVSLWIPLLAQKASSFT